MKKTIVLLISVAMMFGFAACGNSEGGEIKDIPANEVYQKIFDACQAQTDETLPIFEESDESLLSDMYPGLYDIACDGMTIGMHAITGTGAEIAVCKVSDPKDAEKMEAVMLKRIDKGAEDTFYPENSKAWKNNSVTYKYGSYVVLVCMPDGISFSEDDLKAIFEE